MFRAPNGHRHSAVFCALHTHCHSAVFSAPYVHCHSAPYRRSPVLMDVPGPRTSSRQSDAAGSHSCHFTTVLYPRSISECEPPLNRSHRDIPGAVFSVQSYHNIFSVTALFSLTPLQTCQHLYDAIQCTAISSPV